MEKVKDPTHHPSPTSPRLLPLEFHFYTLKAESLKLWASESQGLAQNPFPASCQLWELEHSCRLLFLS